MVQNNKNLDRYHHLIQEFDDTVRFTRKGTAAQALSRALSLYDSFEELITSVGKEYPSVVRSRGVSLEAARRELIKKQEEGSLTRDEVLDFLADFDRWASSVGKDVRRIHSRWPAWASYLWLFFLVFTIGLWKWATMRQPPVNNRGILGYYYNQIQPEGSFKTRLDRDINHFWGRKAPMASFARDLFSVRWQGYLFIPRNGNYQFLMKADDGFIVWIGSTKLIDHWAEGWGEAKGSIDLKRGYYPVKVEYCENTGPAYAQLFWQIPGSRTQRVIEPKYFFWDIEEGKVQM